MVKKDGYGVRKEGEAVGAVCGVGECANRFCEKAESSNCSNLEPGGRIAGKVTQGVYGLWKLRAGRDKTISPAAQRPRDDRRDTVLDKRNGFHLSVETQTCLRLIQYYTRIDY